MSDQIIRMSEVIGKRGKRIAELEAEVERKNKALQGQIDWLSAFGGRMYMRFGAEGMSLRSQLNDQITKLTKALKGGDDAKS